MIDYSLAALPPGNETLVPIE